MNKAALMARTALQGFSYTAEDTTVAESLQLTIVSLAFSGYQMQALGSVLQSKLDLPLPEVGKVSRLPSGTVLLRLQVDQCFLITNDSWQQPVDHLRSLCGNAAYYTDQSDSWVVLDMKGPKWPMALERICPLDLSDSAFSTSQVARTSMEHMSVIIEKPAEEHIRLYSPRSSANSFAHAVETSLRYVSSSTLNEV